MTPPLQMAVVGCGGIASYAAGLARLLPGLRLNACCDLDGELAAGFARRHAIPAVYQDYARLLEEGQPDIVYLAVPHDLHLPMTRAAVERGAAVLCEKPIAASMEAGRELLRLSQQPGARVAINYQNRYETTCYQFVQAARSGAMGRIQHARANIPWRREPGYFATGAGWHSSLARSGGGTLLTQGSHYIDLLLWAMSSPPVAASGVIRQVLHTGVEVEDLAFGLIELENGAVIDVCSTMASPKEKEVTIELYGEKGIAYWKAGRTPSLRWEGVKPPAVRPPTAGLHALQRSIAGIRDWVRGGPPHLASAADALTTLSAVDAVYRSARSGKRETIEL